MSRSNPYKWMYYFWLPFQLERLVKLQLHDAICQLRFYWNSLIHILSLSNSHNNVASMQKNRGGKSQRVIVALLAQHAILFQTVFSFAFLRSYIFFSYQKVKTKSNRNRNCIFFIPFGIPKITYWIISFMLHISGITSPTNWCLYRWVSWNISLVIHENSTSAFNYLDDFSWKSYSYFFFIWYCFVIVNA